MDPNTLRLFSFYESKVVVQNYFFQISIISNYSGSLLICCAYTRKKTRMIKCGWFMGSIELHFIDENFLKNYSDFLVYNIIHLVIIKSAKCSSSFFLWEVKEQFTVVQWKMHKIYSSFIFGAKILVGAFSGIM